MTQVRASTDPRRNRPLSPHLSIYRPIPTMVMSIAHRVTGVTLYLGMALFAWWLVAAAVGPDEFAFANAVLGSPLGLIVLFGFTWALFHHMLGGVRHLIWDTIHLMDRESSTRLAWATLAGSLLLTALAWGFGLVLR